MFKIEKIVKREDNFADWYTSVIHNANLIVYGDIKGTIIFQPNGWAIWESFQNLVNQSFKKFEISNVALPLLIPYQEFAKEAKHLDGFAPECFIVNQVGNKQLENPYIIRPTSEVLFCKYFSYITSSYKNLPIKVNQWCSVMRAEKTTKPFLRNSEFHWQELHSIFSNEQEAFKFTEDIIDLYEDIVRNELCIPVLKGQKTIGERFAGANNTFTIEALMQDGQLLQCGTSHYLAQNFSKIYNIKYQDKDNKFDYVHQHSAGVSTRILGALIMVHGDDHGLVLPPSVAPCQIKINVMNLKNNPELEKLSMDLKQKLQTKYRLKIDLENNGLGFKLSQGEIEGIPIQIILGKETIENKQFTLVRRDNLEKINYDLKDLEEVIATEMQNYKQAIYQKAKNHLDNSIQEVSSIDELKKVLEMKKIAKVSWAGTEEDEKKVKELTGATPRVIIGSKPGKCFFTGKDATDVVIFGRAY